MVDVLPFSMLVVGAILLVSPAIALLATWFHDI